MHTGLSGRSVSRLRLVLGLFFLTLAVPTGVLIYKAYDQLKWESFHQYRTLAEELGGRIDLRLADLIGTEDARPFSDYGFLVSGDHAAPLQRSPLSELPVRSNIPGLVGWFQVDPEGDFSTPLLPGEAGAAEDYGIAAEELGRRESLTSDIRRILTRNRLVELPPGPRAVVAKAELKSAAGETRRDPDEAPSADEAVVYADNEAEAVPSQAAFDRLGLAEETPLKERRQKAASALGRVEDLKLDLSYQRGFTSEPQAPRPASERTLRKEQGAATQSSAAAPTATREGAPEAKVSMFESEMDPFSLSLLDSGHFVLFRKVWRDGRRYIQGALIEQAPFLRGLVEDGFRGTALSRMSDLVVAYRGTVLAAYGNQAGRDYLASAGELTGSLLHQMHLSAPAGDLELIFSISRLPAGPGAAVVGWLAAILSLVLTGGSYVLYRLGLRQIALTRQQQDFVSAVSHELKTPLTSIRMYGEMLREGWAPEDRKRTYYDFICTESERLSRLINNVLQLARLTRNELAVDIKPTEMGPLLDSVLPKLASQAEQAGFELRTDCTEGSGTMVRVDEDFLTQILINLVDNALKFSRDAGRKEVVVGCVRERNGELCLTVRDFGPGIPSDQLKKIFRLFYRAGSELTRETAGTGIGLALVRQLALAMNGRVDVVNRSPGSEFRVSLPAESAAPCESSKERKS